MKFLSFSLLCLVFVLLMVPFCYSDTDDDKDDDEKSSFQGAMKGFGSWFKDSADSVKGKAEDGIDTLKEWAGGISSRFNKAKDKVHDTGVKAKETVSNAGEKVSEEVGSAASKISEHASDAMGSMKGVFT